MSPGCEFELTVRQPGLKFTRRCGEPFCSLYEVRKVIFEFGMENPQTGKLVGRQRLCGKHIKKVIANGYHITKIEKENQ